MAVEKVCRDPEYFEYLRNHISGVRRSWEEILKPELIKDEGFTTSDIICIEETINKHDRSKYDEVEFVPYRKHFYPLYEGEDKESQSDYDCAWNHHQKTNPHHWQYWILLKDEGRQVILDMPVKYVLEMLCDWHSFSLRDPKSTAYQWWKDNKDKMTLSEHTVGLVEEYVGFFKEPLRQLSSIA